MENKKPLQIEAYLHAFQSLTSGGVKFTFTTQETIDPDLLTQFFKLKNKLGWLLFAVREIEFQDMIDLPKIETPVGKKSKSKQLRDVLFRIWEKTKKTEKFDDYYNKIMSSLIETYKNKLNELDT